MSAHTPGPWFMSGVRFRMNGGEWHNVNRYDEALKRDENIACVGFDPRTGAGLADARLIAAAPEQHAALLPIAMFPLEDFAQYDDCADMRVIFKANDWSLTVGDIRRARAAIAKATGATP